MRTYFSQAVAATFEEAAACQERASHRRHRRHRRAVRARGVGRPSVVTDYGREIAGIPV